MFSPLPSAVEVLLLVVALGAAVCDVRCRRIPNWLSLWGAGLGVALNTFLYRGWPGLRLGLLGMTLAFTVYFGFYLLHAMGGGDVKLMAAMGAIAGWQDWFGIFLATALAGGVMALILMVQRRRARKTLRNVAFILSEMKSGRPAYLRREELDVRSSQAVGLPHGAVIAIGCVFFLALCARL